MENQLKALAFSSNLILISEFFKNTGDAFCDFESCKTMDPTCTSLVSLPTLDVNQTSIKLNSLNVKGFVENLCIKCQHVASNSSFNVERVLKNFTIISDGYNCSKIESNQNIEIIEKFQESAQTKTFPFEKFFSGFQSDQIC